jgi:serine/threonine protein kinase
LQTIIARLLRKDPEERYQSTTLLVQDLHTFLRIWRDVPQAPRAQPADQADPDWQ